MAADLSFVKIRAAANLNGLEIETPAFEFGKDNKTPEFLSKFPLGKVPAFTARDAPNICDSDAIAQYVAESGPAAGQLLGTTPAEHAAIRQWICFGASEVMDPVTQLTVPRIGLAAYDEAKEVAALGRIGRSLDCLEIHLKGKTWLASSDKLSLADISVVASLVIGFAFSIDADMRKKCPSVMEWYQRAIGIEHVKKAFQDVEEALAPNNFVEKRSMPQ